MLNYLWRTALAVTIVAVTALTGTPSADAGANPAPVDMMIVDAAVTDDVQQFLARHPQFAAMIGQVPVPASVDQWSGAAHAAAQAAPMDWSADALHDAAAPTQSLLSGG